MISEADANWQSSGGLGPCGFDQLVSENVLVILSCRFLLYGSESIAARTRNVSTAYDASKRCTRHCTGLKTTLNEKMIH